jgi:hypothetical protein
MWDSHPEREVANEMRRDGTSILSNETFSVMFDTFHDKRNGFVFYLTPLAGLMDIQITDEGNRNADWNTVWDARTGKFENGWTVEMVIPFRSLRYNPGPNQVWGLNFRRVVRWKNEWSYLTRIPSFLSSGALYRTRLDAPRLHRHGRSAATDALRLHQVRLIETPRDLARSAAALNGCRAQPTLCRGSAPQKVFFVGRRRDSLKDALPSG